MRSPRKSPRYDYSFTCHGSIWLCHPQTPAALKHLKKHCSGSVWWGDAVAVEPRYVLSLAELLREDGFKVAGRSKA